MAEDCGDLISDLPAEVRELLESQYEGKSSSSVLEMGKKLDYLFKSKMKETSEEFFSFTKGLNIIDQMIKAEGTDVKASDILENLVGETSGTINAVKNDFGANRKDVHKHNMYKEIYAVGDDPKFKEDFDKFMDGKNPEMDKEIWIYMETGGEQGKPTGGYKAIADAIMSMQKKNLTLKQVNAGHQNMGEIENYGLSHGNDGQAILPNRAKWEQKLRDGLDWYKSFGVSNNIVGAQDKVMKKWYMNIESGNPTTPIGLKEGNRSLVFKTKELEYEYYKEFGMGNNLKDKLHADINKVSSQIAIGEKFGPKVTTTMKMVLDFYETQYPGKLSNYQKETIQIQVKSLAGKLQKPSYNNNAIARTNKAAKNLIRSSMLNKAALSGLNDLTSISIKANSDSGGNIWGNFVSSVTTSMESFAKHNDPEYLKMFKDKLGIVLEIQRADLISKYAGDDVGSLKPKNTNWIEDTLAWTSEKTMKVFGAERTGNSIKEAGAIQAKDTMDGILKKNKSEYNFNEKLLLKESGISDAHLNVVKKNVGEVDMARIDTVIENMKPGKERQLLQDASDRLHTFIMSRYNTSSATGTLKSRAQVRGIYEQGHIDTEIMSHIGTFKAPLIDNLRIINENMKIRGMAGNRAQSQALLVAYVLAQGTMMGMGIEWLRTGITTGFGLSEDDKKTERWDDMMERFSDAANFDLGAIGGIWFESVMSSGVMGPAGDYVGGGFSFQGSRLVDRLAGPGLGFVGKGFDAGVTDLVNIGKGEFEFDNIKSLKQLGKSMPFQNAPLMDPFVSFYIKQLLGQE